METVVDTPAPIETPPATPPAAVTPPVPETQPATPPAGTTPAPATPAGTPDGLAPKVPDAYVLTLPKDSPLAGTDLTSIEAEARAMGLGPEHAQKLVERYDHYARQHAIVLEQQLAAVKADPVLGGAQYDTTVRHVDQGLGFSDDRAALQAELEKLGAQNNLVLVRYLAKVGRAQDEDRPVRPGGSVPATKKSLDERLAGV